MQAVHSEKHTLHFEIALLVMHLLRTNIWSNGPTAGYMQTYCVNDCRMLTENYFRMYNNNRVLWIVSTANKAIFLIWEW